jgi:phosphoenolpyruvate phosphomutase
MITPGNRLKLLKENIQQKGFVRIMEAHNGLSALVAESARAMTDSGVIEYDGLWESSLTDSASKGFPDVEVIGMESRLHTIDEILEVTEKLLIVDGDTGRSPVEFEFLVRRLERMGVSAVIIEDKVFPKRNSLDTSANQTLESPDLFAQKIQRGKSQTLTDEFMIIARLESLIAGTGLGDALSRAETYIRAGVDGIMIHSQQKEPDEILAFAAAYGPLCDRLGVRPPLICVPTTYNLITDQELANQGFNVIIHANHLLRSAYKAMEEAASSILCNDRSNEVETICAPTSTIFEVVGFNKVKDADKLYNSLQRFSIIIPAAGKDPIFTESPKSMIQVGGQAIIDHQVQRLKKSGLTNNKVFVVRGHESGQFTRNDVEYIENDAFLNTNSAHSLFCAESAMTDGFLLVYSDILFDETLVKRLLDSEGEIVLLLDKSYRYHTHDVNKSLDLVTADRQDTNNIRSLAVDSLRTISKIGKQVVRQENTFEFVGMGFFSEKGAEILRKIYNDAKTRNPSPFHEASEFSQASFNDIIQEAIDQGHKVSGLEISTGWIEIHERVDVNHAEEELEILRPNRI